MIRQINRDPQRYTESLEAKTQYLGFGESLQQKRLRQKTSVAKLAAPKKK
jgi:hypothetical protein